jgi:hypothetical protein
MMIVFGKSLVIFFTKEVCKIRFDLKVEDVVIMLPYNGPCLKVFLCV